MRRRQSRSVRTAGRAASAVLLAFAALGMAACGDSSGPGGDILPAELAARWVASPSCAECGFTAASVTNPADSLNIVHVLKMTVVLDIERSGTFRLIYGSTASEGNAVLASPGVLVVTDAAGTRDTIDFVIRASLLDIDLRRTFSIDVNGDGLPEDTRASGTFRRN